MECRYGRGRHTLVFTFSENVVSGTATLTGGVGQISGNPIFSGNTMTVGLRNVTDVQKITVTLMNVTSSLGHVLPSTPVSMNALTGDVDGNKAVNNTDVNLTRGQVGMPVTGSNFREDVRVDGAINRTDVRAVKADLGHNLP